MFMLFDNTGFCIGNCSHQPDAADLTSRGEFAVEYNEAITGRLFFDFDSNTIEDRPNAPDAPDAYHIWDAEKKEWFTNDDLQTQKATDIEMAKQVEVGVLLSQAAQKISEYQDFIELAENAAEVAIGEKGYTEWKQYRVALLKYQKGLILEKPEKPE